MKILLSLVIVSSMFVLPVGADATAVSPDTETVMEPKTIDELIAVDEMIAARARAALDRAQQQAEDGDGEGAVASMAEVGKCATQLAEIYENYIEANPADPRAHNLFGNVCYDLLGDKARAVSLWEKALELDPEYADAHNNIGTHYLHEGEPGRAMDEFRTAVKLAPNSADYHFNLAQAYYLFRQVAQEKYGWSLAEVYEHTLEESRTGSQLKPEDFKLAEDYAMTFFGAEGFGVMADWAEARAAWKRCRELVDDESRLFVVLLHMARVELRAGAYADARGYAEQALALKPGNAVAQRLIEMSSRESGPLSGIDRNATETFK